MAGGSRGLASYPRSGNAWCRIFLENLFRNADRPVSINALGVFGFGDAHIPLYERFAGRPLAELDDTALHALREPLSRHLARRPAPRMVKPNPALAHLERSAQRRVAPPRASQHSARALPTHSHKT